MSLQQLVQHFNDRFAFEHHANFHPFLLEKGLVSGIFGPIRISSVFAPVWQTNNYEQLIGHITQLSVMPYDHELVSEQCTEIDPPRRASSPGPGRQPPPAPAERAWGRSRARRCPDPR